MKKYYQELLIEIRVVQGDIITYSAPFNVEQDENELPFVPFE